MPKTFVRIHFSFNVFPILKDILVFTQLYQQPFLLYLALLRETPRDGRRDEEIRLNRIWLETRHTPQTLFLYRASRFAIAVIFHVRSAVKSSRRQRPCTHNREHGSSSVDDGDTFRSIVRHSPRFFAARESGVKTTIWPILHFVALDRDRCRYSGQR